MKKKLISVTLSVVLLLGSMQVFAATALDTNIINLIRNSFNSIRSYYQTAVNGESDSLKLKYLDNVSSIINDIFDTSAKDIENHKNNELKRADQELQAYVNEKKGQVDSIAKDEVKKSKDEITNNVNSNITDIKAAIDKEFEKQIKTKLK